MTHERDRNSPLSRGRVVLNAALQAWEWHGVTCRVRTSEDPTGAIAGALDLPDVRHVEVFVEKIDEDVWRSIENWKATDEWTVRAVLPLSAIGRAHDELRERGCELQGYWMNDDGNVAFGAVEIA